MHGKTTSTSGIRTDSSSNFPCCIQTGIHSPIPRSWLGCYLGRSQDLSSHMISYIKGKCIWVEVIHGKPKEAGGGGKGFYLAERWNCRTFTFLWGSTLQWHHFVRFALRLGVVIRMWIWFPVNYKMCSSQVAFTRRHKQYDVGIKYLALAVSGYRTYPAELISR